MKGAPRDQGLVAAPCRCVPFRASGLPRGQGLLPPAGGAEGLLHHGSDLLQPLLGLEAALRELRLPPSPGGVHRTLELTLGGDGRYTPGSGRVACTRQDQGQSHRHSPCGHRAFSQKAPPTTLRSGNCSNLPITADPRNPGFQNGSGRIPCLGGQRNSTTALSCPRISVPFSSARVL